MFSNRPFSTYAWSSSMPSLVDVVISAAEGDSTGTGGGGSVIVDAADVIISDGQGTSNGSGSGGSATPGALPDVSVDAGTGESAGSASGGAVKNGSAPNILIKSNGVYAQIFGFFTKANNVYGQASVLSKADDAYSAV